MNSQVNTIPLHYFSAERRPNFGDLLNVEICKLFGYNCEYAEPQKAKANMIGSMLQYHLLRWDQFKNSPEELKALISSVMSTENILNIWGSGFINDYTQWCEWYNIDPTYNVEIFTRNFKVHAIRGMLSRDRLQQFTDEDLSQTILGDPGLLTPYFFDYKNIKKQYALGVIVSSTEDASHPFYSNLPKDSILIDTRDDLFENLTKLASCENILSSAMHGCVVADSFNIPNLRLNFSELYGRDYKWIDLYSAYNIEYITIPTITFEGFDNYPIVGETLKVSEISLNFIPYIQKNYKISKEQVNSIQKGLIVSFPYESDFQNTIIKNMITKYKEK